MRNGPAGLQVGLQFLFAFRSPTSILPLFRGQLLRAGRGTEVAQLAQAYIHLKPYEASDRKIRALGEYAYELAWEAAAEVYGGGVTIDVELEEGSLRSRITVLGHVGAVLLGTYGFIAGYKGFKEGIHEMCDDAREFAVDVCAPFIKKAGVAKEDVYRFERRLKAPGKIYRLSSRLETLERSINDLSPNAIKSELAKARSDLDALANELSDEDMKFIRERLPKKGLPAPSKWPEPELQKVAIKQDEVTQSFLFGAEAIDDEDQPLPRKRIVFRKKSFVPEKKNRRRTKDKSEKSLLLSPTTEQPQDTP